MADDVELGNPRKRAKLDKSLEFDRDYDSAERETNDSTDIQLSDTDLDGQRNAEEGGRTDEEMPDTSKSSPSDKLEDDKENGTDDSSDDDSSSDISDFSNMSGLSEEAWKGTAVGPMSWVQKMIEEDQDPRTVLQRLMPDEDLQDITSFPDIVLWKLIVNIVSEPPRRKKLNHVNTIDDVVNLMKTCTKIMVLTGAGVSVSCGIPDFRSRDGVYARLAVDFPDLPDPQAMFDIRYFKNDQRPFFKFAKEIYPGQFEPSKSHKFIRLIEKNGKLLRNYTQNIDTLEQVAGIQKVIQCHGSFATATCMTCGFRVDAEYIKEDIMNQVIPHCPSCPAEIDSTQDSQDNPKLRVLKPDIVFFGESLPEQFHSQMAADKDVCDLLIVIGSSLKVRPVALIPNSLPPHVPQVLINREPLKHLNFDVELLGDGDVIVSELCRRLGAEWPLPGEPLPPLQEIGADCLLTPPTSPSSGSDAPTSTYRQEKCSVGSDSNITENTSSACKDDISDMEETIASKQSELCQQSPVAMEMVKSPTEGSFHVDIGFTDNEVNDNSESGQGDTVENGIVKVKATVPDSDKTGSVLDNVSRVKQYTIENSDPVMEIKSDDRSVEADGKASCTTQNSQDEKVTASSMECVSKDASSEVGERTEERGATLVSSANSSMSSDMEQMKKFWKPKLNVAKRLPKNQYLFKPPCRYVFPGAEVYEEVDDESDDIEDIMPAHCDESEDSSENRTTDSLLTNSISPTRCSENILNDSGPRNSDKFDCVPVKTEETGLEIDSPLLNGTFNDDVNQAENMFTSDCVPSDTFDPTYDSAHICS